VQVGLSSQYPLKLHQCLLTLSSLGERYGVPRHQHLITRLMFKRVLEVVRCPFRHPFFERRLPLYPGVERFPLCNQGGVH
jgi:hypothetical protein